MRQLHAAAVSMSLFNITNRPNFNNPTGDLRDSATFLILRSIRGGGPRRTAQLSLKDTF